MVQLLSSKMQQREQIDWRRAKVLELSSQGHNQSDIASILKVDKSIVSRDITYLKLLAQQNLQKHIQDKLPEEYQRCLTGMNQVLKISWQIANNTRQNSQNPNDNSNIVTTGDDRTRLQALSLINDCYKHIMDLTTNGIVITDAIKFVQSNKEKLTSTMSNKEGDGNKEKDSKEPDIYEDENQLEEKQEEEIEIGEGEPKEETTNQVF